MKTRLAVHAVLMRELANAAGDEELNARDRGMTVVEARWMTFWSNETPAGDRGIFAADISFGHLNLMEPTTELDIDMIAARLADTDGDMRRGLLHAVLQDSLPGLPHWLEGLNQPGVMEL